MTIDELISDLEDARETMPAGGATEIRIAYQPNWPLRATLDAVTIPEGPEDDEDYDDENAVDPEDAQFLWIATGEGQPYGERPYAPKWAFRS